jgi:hypothetical protein
MNLGQHGGLLLGFVVLLGTFVLAVWLFGN